MEIKRKKYQNSGFQTEHTIRVEVNKKLQRRERRVRD